MVQVPGCSDSAGGGSCASAIVNAGFCRADTGDPVLVVTVVSCSGSTISTTITDLSTGDPYVGPIVACGGDCCDDAVTSVLDTNSIDLSLVGNVLSADLQLDPASPSPLTVTANGLYVECCEDAATNAIDTNSIDLTLIGGNLSADLQLDPASPAPLSITANGLYVECCDDAIADVADTDSVDMVLTGDVISANVRIDPASTAPVSIGPDGIRIDCCDDENDGGWITQIKLGNETITDATGINVVDLAGFTPVAGAVYEFEAALLVSSSVANNGTRGRIQFPAAMTACGWTSRSVDGSSGLESIAYGGPSALNGASNVPIVNTPFLMAMRGIADVGGAPAAGNIRPQVATENAGVAVTVWRGSMFKWRRIL